MPYFVFFLTKIRESNRKNICEDFLSKFEKHNIKRISKKQKEVVEQISNLIVANEDPKNWLNSVEKYCDSPVDQNPEKVTEINNLAHEHQLDHYLASILYASKCNIKHEEN